MKIYSPAPLNRTMGYIKKTDLNIGTQSWTRDLVFNYENGLLCLVHNVRYTWGHIKKTSVLCRDGYRDISRVLLRCLQGRLCCRMDPRENFFTVYLQECYRSGKRHHYLSTGFPVSKSFPVRFGCFPSSIHSSATLGGFWEEVCLECLALRPWGSMDP